ncbi:MAG: 50S ribosomal protein L28 [Chloroflexota bacterium]|nr:50S ribosomal protein L28 [Chloroflexota bacterium]
MSGKCDVCGKTPQFGCNVSHSKRHTNRQWNVNTQKKTMLVNGKKVQLSLCTRCLRTQNKPVV